MLSFWDRASQYLAQPIRVFQRAVTFELKHCVLGLLVWFTFKTLCGSFMVKCTALPEDCPSARAAWRSVCRGVGSSVSSVYNLFVFLEGEFKMTWSQEAHLTLVFCGAWLLPRKKKGQKIKDKNSLYSQRFVVLLTSLTCLLKFLPRRICMMKCIIR